MKVVVTGGNGLVGRYVVAELAKSRTGNPAHVVTVFDRIERRLPRPVSQIVGDHSRIDDLLAAFEGADAVLHLSALQPTTPPLEEVFTANVQGTKNVFAAATQCGVKKVVNWSSVWALGWSESGNTFLPDYLPIDEDHPLRADDSYGRSKIEGEAIAQSCHGQDGLEVITLRPAYTATPAALARLWRTKGLRNPDYSHLAYVDARDQARAARLALEHRDESYFTLYLAADDSRAAEPLCDLLPRLHSPIGDRAARLTGWRSSISNQRAKDVLGWFPLHSWRSLTVAQRARAYATAGIRGTARRAIPSAARERLQGRNR